MNRENLKQVIIDQKEIYLNNPLVKRDFEPEEKINYCFVGIRRTGKSYMIFQKVKNLIESGVPLDEILYVNFEDERLLEVTTEDLNLILEIGIEIAGEGRLGKIC